MSNSINTKYNINTKLTQDMICAKQAPYNNVQSAVQQPKSDVVEISDKKDAKKSKWAKFGKIAAAIGGAALVTAGVFVGKKKIDAKKAKELETEARRVAEESRQKAREAEEKARIEAEERAQAQRKVEAEARQKAKLEEEARAKAEAEERARIEAEKTKEAERLAQIAEYNKKLERVTAKFEQRCVIKPCVRGLDYDARKELQKAIYGTTMEEYGQFFVDSVKKAEEEGIKFEDITKIYERMHDSAMLSDDAISSIADSYAQMYYDLPHHVKHQLKARRQFMQDFDKLKQENPQKETEKLSDYLQRLVNKRKENVEAEKQKRIETIKSRLNYVESAAEEEKIELNTDEIEELREALIKRKCTPAEKEEMKNADLNKLMTEYIQEATSDYDAPEVSDRIQKACFSKMKRYNSTTSQREYDELRDDTYRYEPLYRWMRFGNKCDEFTEETFKIGGEYVFPSKQSCSKNKGFAETMFRDDNPEMNFKFVIHPATETSRAVDIGRGHYGCNEAVYYKGERFRVIDVYDEEVIDKRPNVDSSYWDPRSIYHKVVHLQELP